MSAHPLGVFRVHYEDGREPVEVRIRSKAVVAAERRWPGRKEDGSDKYPMQEGLHFLVWTSMGAPGGDFDKWLDDIAAVEVADEEETAVPFKPVAGVA